MCRDLSPAGFWGYGLEITCGVRDGKEMCCGAWSTFVLFSFCALRYHRSTRHVK
jgi:hypothetical protein